MDARLERFRQYFERLDPASGPSVVLAEDRYAVPPGRSMAEQLASRLKLAPTSSHLVTGAVGTGKTTQLHQAAEILRSAGDTRAVYVDVSLMHDLDKDLAGVLLVLAGLELSKLVGRNADEAVSSARALFRRLAHGHREFVEHDPSDEGYYDDDPGDEEPGYWRSVPPVLTPPLSPLSSATTERVDALKTLKQALPGGVQHVVLLFDSLDRLDDAEAFRKAAVEDVRALREAGIGIVLVGPMRLLYGTNRQIADLFDQLHIAPAYQVAESSESRDFLLRVLAKRTDESALAPEARGALVDGSGGLLRDLLELARSAVEEAFVAGDDVVTTEHVARAVDEFGRTMMLGLANHDIDTLDRLRRSGTFVPTDDNTIALLVSRRVIEYPSMTKRYALHPAIAPLVASLRRKM